MCLERVKPIQEKHENIDLSTVTRFSEIVFNRKSYTKLNSLRGGERKMNHVDYDRALYYTHRSEWDNLLILMVRTKDQFLAKKIEHFLHAYNFEKDYSVIEKHLYSLLRYIDHANDLVGANDGLLDTAITMG
jgi:hypothetical protein